MESAVGLRDDRSSRGLQPDAALEVSLIQMCVLTSRHRWLQQALHKQEMCCLPFFSLFRRRRGGGGWGGWGIGLKPDDRHMKETF